MQNSSDAGASKRPIILYIIIAVLLFAALILTVRFAKSRADFYGQQQTGQGQQVAEQPESQPQGASQPEQSEVATTESQSQSTPQTQPQETTPSASLSTSAPGTSSQPSAVANTGPPVHVVPSTGPEQVVLPIISLGAVVFAALTYTRTRRRLRDQALAR